jgi:hypothetical protein
MNSRLLELATILARQAAADDDARESGTGYALFYTVAQILEMATSPTEELPRIDEPETGSWVVGSQGEFRARVYLGRGHWRMVSPKDPQVFVPESLRSHWAAAGIYRT